LTFCSLTESKWASNNHYNTAILSGCFPAGRGGTINLYNNDLTSLDISNDPGLFHLNASRNSLNQTAVDGVLQTLDSYETTGGYLDLTGNAEPSITGATHANNLVARGWKVQGVKAQSLQKFYQLQVPAL
jgi:hypothetical protein